MSLCAKTAGDRGEETRVSNPTQQTGMDLAGCRGHFLWARHEVCAETMSCFKNTCVCNNASPAWVSLTCSNCIFCKMPTDNVNHVHQRSRQQTVAKDAVGLSLAWGRQWLLDLAMGSIVVPLSVASTPLLKARLEGALKQQRIIHACSGRRCEMALM